MNVLEKILEEIEEATFQEDAPVYVGDTEVDGYVLASRVKEIIRSHMDDVPDTNISVNSNLIDRQNLKEEIESLRMTITGTRSGKTMTAQALEEYKKSILRIIDEQPTIYADDGWIPVSKRLPGSSDNGESLDITKELAVYSRNVLMQYCNSQRDCSKCCFELNGGCSLISGPPCIWAKKGVSENGIQKS